MTARTIVVAGGSRGIGGEVAARLAVAGHRVIVGCREKHARARRMSERVVAAGGRALDVRVGDLRAPEVRRDLLRDVDHLDVLVLAASGGMEVGSSDASAFALNRDALVALAEKALVRMGRGGVIVYLTSHQAHFSRDVVPESEYARVAASKRAGEDGLRALADRVHAVGARLVVVSADAVVDSATTLLLERRRPGSTAQRLREVTALPTTREVADTVLAVIDGSRPFADTVYHGGTEWFLQRGAVPEQARCARIARPGSERACASALVRRLRAELGRRGITALDRVLVCDESTPETALVVLALMGTGASVVLIDPGLPPAEVAAIATRSACTVAVTAPSRASARDRRDLGSSEGLVAAVEGRRECACGVERSALLDTWAGRDDALVLWTSGSSGRPRGVVRSGASVLANVSATVEAMGYRADDVLLPLLPISHQYGFSLVVAWWLVGCTLVLGNHRRPVKTLADARSLGITVVDAAPSVIDDVLRAVEARGLGEVAPRVRMWCVGGSPLRASLARRFLAETGQTLLDGYGSTELGNVSLATLDRPEGLGRLLPGVAVAIRRPDGSPADAGETGELWIRSDHAFTATLDDERPVEVEDGWYRTGDIGSRDAAGVLRVIGRAGAVHRGGFTVYGSHLEDRADEAGIPLTLIALPDERRGAHLTAFIEDHGPGTRTDWAERLRAVLPRHEWPNRVVVVPDLPRLGNGKVDRARLTHLAAAGRTAARKGGRPDVVA